MMLLNLALALAPLGEQLTPIATLPESYEIVRDAWITWSPDGKRVALPAVLDGEVRPLWTDADGWQIGDGADIVQQPAFSDDSAHVAFVVGKLPPKKKPYWSVWVDGKSLGEEDWIGEAMFWPGTETPVFWTRVGAKWRSDGTYRGGAFVLHVGKKKGKKWKGKEIMVSTCFSADGSTAGAVVPRPGNLVVLLASPKKQWAAGKLTSYSSQLALSADGKAWALAEFVVDSSSDPSTWRPTELLPMRWFVRRGDEQLGGEYLGADRPVFAPEAERLAFRAKGPAGYGVVIADRGVSKLEFDFVSEIVWEPAGEGLAFVAIDVEEESSGFTMGLVPPVGGKAQVICMDAEGEQLGGGPEFDEILDLVVAPGGAAERNLAYRARADHEWFLVHEWSDGEGQHVTKSAPYRAVGPPVFTERGVEAGVFVGREFSWLRLTR